MTIPIIVGVAGAELGPNYLELAKELPSDEMVNSMHGADSCTALAYKQFFDQERLYYCDLHGLQTMFKGLNPSRIWDKVKEMHLHHQMDKVVAGVKNDSKIPTQDEIEDWVKEEFVRHIKETNVPLPIPIEPSSIKLDDRKADIIERPSPEVLERQMKSFSAALSNDAQLDFEGLEKLAKEIQKLKAVTNYSKQELQKKENWKNTIKVVSTALHSAMDVVQGDNNDKRRLQQSKDLAKSTHKAHTDLFEDLDRKSFHYYSEVQTHFSSPEAYFTHLNEIADNFMKGYETLKSTIAKSGQELKEIKGTLTNIKALDENAHKIFQGLIEDKQALGKECRIFAAVLRTVGSVCAFFPPAMPAGIAFNEAGSVFGEAARMMTDEAVAGLQAEQQQIANNFMAAAQKTHQVGEQVAERAYVAQVQLDEKRDFENREGHQYFDPQTHQKHLHNNLNELEQEKKNSEAEIQNLHGKYHSMQVQLASANAKARKCKKKKDKKGLQKAISSAESIKAEMLKISQDLGAKTSEVQKKQGQSEKTKQALELAGNTHVSDSRQVWHDMLQKQNPNPNESDEEKKARVHTEEAIFQWMANSSLYDQLQRPYDEMGAALINNMGAVFHAYSPSPKPEQIIALGSQLWEIRKICMKLNTITLPALYSFFAIKKPWGFDIKPYLPQLPELLKLPINLSGPAFAGASGFIIFNFAIPVLKGLVSIASCKSLWNSIRSTEKPQPSAMEKAFTGLFQEISHLQDTLNDKSKVLGDDFANKMLQLSVNLAATGEQLILLIEKGFKDVLLKMDKTEYRSHVDLVDIHNRKNQKQLEPMLLETINGKLDKINPKKLHLSLIKLKQSIQDSSMAPFNGSNSNILPSLLPQQPEYFSSILGNSKDVPNLKMFERSVQNFIEYTNSLFSLNQNKATQVQVLLQNDSSESKKQILDICKVVKSQEKSIDALFEELERVAKELITSRNYVWNELEKRKLRMQAVGKTYQRFFAMEAYVEFKKKASNEPFIGSKKFIWSKVANHKILDLSSINFLTLHDVKFYGSTAMAKVSRVASTTLLALGTGIFTAGLTTIGLLVVVPAVTLYRNGKLECNDYDLNEMPEKLKKLQEQMKFIEELSLRNAFISNTLSIEQNPLPDEEKFATQLIKNADETPVASIDIDVGIRWPKNSNLPLILYPKIGINLNPEIMSPKDLASIPDLQINNEEYDKSVKTFMDNYFLFLDHLVNGDSLSSDNPFSKMIGAGTLLKGIDTSLVLYFPNELIEGLKDKFKREIHYVEASEAGTFIPFYSFNSKMRSIEIHFKFISKENTESSLQPKDHTTFTVADFDTRTMRTFQKDFIWDPKNPNLTEFILTAMYGGLGLPGSETYNFENSVRFAVKDVPFPGLFELWKICPQMIRYRSKEVTAQMCDKLSECIAEDNDPHSAAPGLFQPYFPQRLGEGFIDTWLNKLNFEKSFSQLESQFHKNYSLFVALSKLLSGIEEKQLFKNIENYFDIMSVSHHKEIRPEIKHGEDEENLKMVSDEIVTLFISQLRAIPSKILASIQSQLPIIGNLENFVHSQEKPRKIEVEPTKEKPFIRLPNITNSCYINATIQALKAVQFDQFIQKIENPSLLIAQLKDVFVNLKDESKLLEALIAFRESLFIPSANLDADFTHGLYEQKDASALMQMTLASCNYELSMITTTSGIDTTKQIAHQIQENQKANILYLPIEGKTLSDVIFNYFISKSDSPWNPVDENGTNLDIKNRTIIKTIAGEPPEILVFQLLRYIVNPKFNNMKELSENNLPYIKNNAFVEFPKEGILDLSRYMEKGVKALYKIKSTVDHHGLYPTQGHYTASYIADNEWITASDDIVYNTASDKVMKNNHYLYILRRIDK